MTTASEGSVEQVIHDNQGFKESDAAERKPKEGDDDDDEDDDDGKHESDSNYFSFCKGLCKLNDYYYFNLLFKSNPFH